MRNIIISLLVLFGTTFTMNAQDRLVLRNGRTVEVKIQRSLEDRVEYNYPGETTVYERPKSAISAIYYENGQKEILDENLKNKEVTTQERASSQERTSSSRANSQANSEGVLWQDVKTTFTAEDVNDLKRLQRVTAMSRVSYKDAILQLKKKAAEIGGTTVLVMDDPDSTEGEEIEVIGIAYRDESISASKPAVAASREQRPATSAQTSSNTRRRRILQQMDSYNNDSKLDLSSSEPEPRREQNNSTGKSSSSKERTKESTAPDAVQLLDGRMIYGTIEEFEPDDFVSIRTEDGKVYEYSMDDVRRVQRSSTATTAKAKGSSSRSSARTSSARQNVEDDDRYGSRTSRYGENVSSSDDGSVSGYKGTFDAGYTLPISVGEQGRIEFHTSHGYQLNDYLFVGVGAGLHIYSARDMNMKYAKIGGEDNYPHYVGDSSSGVVGPDASQTMDARSRFFVYDRTDIS